MCNSGKIGLILSIVLIVLFVTSLIVALSQFGIFGELIMLFLLGGLLYKLRDKIFKVKGK